MGGNSDRKTVIQVTTRSITAPYVDVCLGKQRLAKPLPTRPIGAKQQLRRKTKGKGPSGQCTPEGGVLAEGEELFGAAGEGQEIPSI